MSLLRCYNPEHQKVMATSLAQVPKQYYGYSLQCTECVNLLLDSAPGSVVSVEVFEDVGVTEPNGKVKAVQTKSGSGTNPNLAKPDIFGLPVNHPMQKLQLHAIETAQRVFSLRRYVGYVLLLRNLL